MHAATANGREQISKLAAMQSAPCPRGSIRARRFDASRGATAPLAEIEAAVARHTANAARQNAVSKVGLERHASTSHEAQIEWSREIGSQLHGHNNLRSPISFWIAWWI